MCSPAFNGWDTNRRGQALPDMLQRGDAVGERRASGEGLAVRVLGGERRYGAGAAINHGRVRAHRLNPGAAIECESASLSILKSHRHG